MSSGARWTIGILVLVLGVLLIVVGAQLESGFWSSLLLELGVTALVVLPLLWLERVLERRVELSEEKTREHVDAVAVEIADVSGRLEDTRRSLADVRQQLEDRLRAAADADFELVERAKANLSFDAVASLLDRAAQLGAVSQDGVRVALPGRWERLRFNTSIAIPPEGDGDREPVILMRLEGANGDDLGIRVSWTPSEPADEALLALAEAWKRDGTYPGNAALDAEQIFDRLLLTLEIAIRSRQAGGDDQLDPVIELISPNWALTDFGLEHLPAPYQIDRERLKTEEDLAHWRGHMRDKSWSAEEDGRATESREPDFWMVTEVAHRYFSQPGPFQYEGAGQGERR